MSAGGFFRADRPKPESAMNNIELAEHIEATHHEYLKRELPLASELARKVAEAHSRSDSRLCDLVLVLRRFVDRLQGHMRKEERSLFPAIRKLDKVESKPSFWFGTIEKPICSAEAEHRDADKDERPMGWLSSLQPLLDVRSLLPRRERVPIPEVRGNPSSSLQL